MQLFHYKQWIYMCLLRFSLHIFNVNNGKIVEMWVQFFKQYPRAQAVYL